MYSSIYWSPVELPAAIIGRRHEARTRRRCGRIHNIHIRDNRLPGRAVIPRRQRIGLRLRAECKQHTQRQERRKSGKKRATLSGRPLHYSAPDNTSAEVLCYSPAWLMCFADLIASIT